MHAQSADMVNVKGPFCHVDKCRKRRALSRFCVDHLEDTFGSSSSIGNSAATGDRQNIALEGFPTDANSSAGGSWELRQGVCSST
jgi:hypothetical protein